MALNGWHSGERSIHTKLGHDDDPDIMNNYQWIRRELAEEMPFVYANVIPFVGIVTLDPQGRPWSSILIGENAELGFAQSPQPNSLQFRAKLWPGDPLLDNLDKASARSDQGEKILVAGVGVDYQKTRRRLKFAGRVEKYKREGYLLDMMVSVNQAIWNCPKYIPTHNLKPYLDPRPRIVYEKRSGLSPSERLPDDVISFILNADTTFFGTSYEAPPSEAELFPSHLGLNERSGNRGFIRVMPSDGRTIVLPDYSGNRFMTTLGNIETTPVASLTFVSWTTGAVLYITGSAENHLLPHSHSIMPFQNVLTTIRATGYVLVADAFPLRQHATADSETGENPSSYSPPIRLLAEETKERGMILFEETEGNKIEATLTKVDLHSADIATFTWEVNEELYIKPGQAVILDFTHLLGPQAYQHMANDKPSKVNDDRLRTWTVSSTSNSKDGRTRAFSLTMREKVGGAITGALFSITRRLLEARPAMLKDARKMGLKVRVAGVTGDFVLPEARVQAIQDVPTKFLWIAGGIGITPFLSMLNGLAADNTKPSHADIHLILSTREPEVLVPLLSSAISALYLNKEIVRHRIAIDVFSHKPIPDLDRLLDGADGLRLRRHRGRLDGDIKQLFDAGDDGKDRRAYLCGPPEFERAVLGLLKRLGVGDVRTESFGY